MGTEQRALHNPLLDPSYPTTPTHSLLGATCGILPTLNAPVSANMLQTALTRSAAYTFPSPSANSTSSTLTSPGPSGNHILSHPFPSARS
ncbi:hypothetical protein GJ744_002241 [Endocarpon pusillum]|uniref:Uncharacterized protein n=1 Tax=Endocarpon pusillum TaxID=364733 RepID=A0A8H7AAZ9_9EURO|nr:hypothetical protein GJ744_002241 [Endocarpon pusillum]